MIELQHDALVFSFPEVHPEARLSIDFQRTLRIPDDGKDYPLPPGLGRFPLRHVDDFAKGVPPQWLEHGGIMLPMYQSEALWINFGSEFIPDHSASYPFAVRIATGKINAVNGKPWKNNYLRSRDDHVIVPGQPWLDGYRVEKGCIRQFVAMPLGAGYTVEEQMTGSAEYGGLQIAVYPMKRAAFGRHFPRWPKRKVPVGLAFRPSDSMVCARPSASSEMGLAPGGRMRQEIYEDTYDLDEWNQDAVSRCFVHIANSLIWQAITRQSPPTVPPTANEYTKAGLPWFEYYSDSMKSLGGAPALKDIKSIATIGKEKGDVPLPENESVTPEGIVMIGPRLRKAQVREGQF